MLRHAETRGLADNGRINRRQGLAHFVCAAIAHHQKTRRLRQPQQQHHSQYQRQHATDQQQAVPAERRDQLGGNETTTGHTQVEATEHAGDQQRLEPLRGVLGEQCGGIGHTGAKAQAGQKAQHQQLVDVAAVGRGQAEGAKHQHRPHQHHLAPETVGQGARAQGTEDHTDQRRAHHRAEAGAVDPPVLGQRRGDKAHGSGIQAIKKDNQETQDHYAPLIARQRLRIDKGLHIKAVPDSSLRTVHYFYPVGARLCAGRA
ncbi:hypothetical protein D3C77_367690 [compost metagenome]